MKNGKKTEEQEGKKIFLYLGESKSKKKNNFLKFKLIEREETEKKNSKRKKFELQECLLSIILFTISTPFGHLFPIFFCFLLVGKSAMKREKERKKKGCVSPVCSEFQSDVQRGYCGCKWTFMKKYFTHALKNLHRIQKMGKKKEESKQVQKTDRIISIFFFSQNDFCFVFFDDVHIHAHQFSNGVFLPNIEYQKKKVSIVVVEFE